ncbi:DUF5666 domain-containing protein [Patescibacteria group bacterium]|nr:DUF5666 domain-containing protein [Patescibacteria group bacterium]MCL5409673.1 DUF5666 domain-containing protein [Patescibacteria group bacterium]
MKNPIIIVVLVIVVGAAAFYGGMKYQQSRLVRQFANGTGSLASGNTQFRTRGGSDTNNQAIRGQIMSVDNGSMTIKLQNGSSKIVLLSGQTTVDTTTESSASALKTGDQVMAIGATNSDGSVTASNVQINPQGIATRGGAQPQQ